VDQLEDLASEGIMGSEDKIKLSWHGTAHYHIRYKDLRIVIDPLYTRPLAIDPT
jgi:L-ascorbate metabolism protein UlaG (beta-lactamase superfamily)